LQAGSLAQARQGGGSAQTERGKRPNDRAGLSLRMRSFSSVSGCPQAKTVTSGSLAGQEKGGPRLVLEKGSRARGKGRGSMSQQQLALAPERAALINEA